MCSSFFSCIEMKPAWARRGVYRTMVPQPLCYACYFRAVSLFCAEITLPGAFGKPLLHEALVSSCPSWLSGCSGTAKNSLGGALKDLPSTQALTWRLVSRYPRGTDLGEMCHLPGSNEGGSREGKEKRNAREGTCLAPSRGMREREHERTRAGKCGKRRGNRISKEHQKQTSIKEKRSTTESK